MKTSQKIIVVSCTCLLVIVSVGYARRAKLYTAKAEKREQKSSAEYREGNSGTGKRSGRTRKRTGTKRGRGEKEVITEEQPQAKGKKIAIDPGHQGPNVDMSDLEPMGPGSQEMKAKASSGTQGRYTNVPEYELTLNISASSGTGTERI